MAHIAMLLESPADSHSSARRRSSVTQPRGNSSTTTTTGRSLEREWQRSHLLSWRATSYTARKPKVKVAVRSLDRGASCRGKTKTDEDTPNSWRKGLGASTSPSSPLPLQIGNPRCDDFDVLPIHGEHDVYVSVDFYINIWAPSRVPMKTPENPYRTIKFQLAMQDPCLFHVTVALARADWLLAQSHPDPDPDRRKMFLENDSFFLYHRGMALQKLAGNFGGLNQVDRCDDATIATTCCLMYIDFRTRNFRAFDLHYRATRKMIAARGPSARTDTFLRHETYNLDAFDLMREFLSYVDEDGQSPGSPRETSGDDDKPLVEEPDHDFSRYGLPEMFHAMAVAGILSPYVLNRVGKLATHVQSGQFPMSRCSFEVSTPTTRDPVALDINALRSLSSSSKLAIEKLAFWGVQAVGFQMYSRSTLTAMYRKPICQAVDRLLAVDVLGPSFGGKSAASTAAARKLWRLTMIWTSIAVAGAVDRCPDPPPNGHLVIWRILDAYPKTVSWLSLERILKSFFWSEELLASWQSCWQVQLDRYLEAAETSDPWK